ncbi:thioredoxin family protein [Sediminitomix flava]|nr:thioredoxin family protein [Sediminitomix flava]
MIIFKAWATIKEDKIHWLAFDEAVTEAQKTERMILIDVYTEWCGWCKHMGNKTYQDDHLASYVNSHFLPVKLNAETRKKILFKGEPIPTKEFVRQQGVKVYPSIIIMDDKGSIRLLEGYHNEKELMSALKALEESR